MIRNLSVVLPCLNEKLTLAKCIEEIRAVEISSDLNIEIIVADNGSSDGSVELAESLHVKVVNVITKGYGSAVDAGIRASTFELVLMADSDMSYNFHHIPQFLEAIVKTNADLVIGNRFLGQIEKGAMPRLHKYFGNPALSAIGRLFFRIKIRDFHCGIRILKKSTYLKACTVTTGMEYATEMIARFANIGAVILEVPTDLRVDGRNRPPHLRSFPDGWRHLKMMLLYSPNWFLINPGLILYTTGSLGLLQYVLSGKITIGIASGNVQMSIWFLFIQIAGTQLISAGLQTIAFAQSKGIMRFTSYIKGIEFITNAKAILVSFILILSGSLGFVISGLKWVNDNFSSQDPIGQTKYTIFYLALFASGFQLLLTSVQIRQLLSKFW
jgi:glycosyltransferase involved in cell wall biosynthesis